jgi:hypothetical protein
LRSNSPAEGIRAPLETRAFLNIRRSFQAPRSILKHDVFELLATRKAVEIAGHHAPAALGHRSGGARTIRRHQHIGQCMERATRRSPVRLGLGGILPPYIKRGVERILVDNARPATLISSSARIIRQAAGSRSVLLFPARGRTRSGPCRKSGSMRSSSARENGFSRHGIGDRTVVGPDNAAFEARRALHHFPIGP